MISDTSTPRPTAVVMNLFYTGLGIVRSLGEQRLPVIGLTAQRGIYGNVTRYGRTMMCADSREAPERLLEQLLALGRRFETRAILFPTRDHDLVFLDRYRDELAPFFAPVIASRAALDRALNKWETYRAAVAAGVPTPRSWLVQEAGDLQRALPEITYPCVLKPLAAHHWRSAGNWELVGARKAISIASRDALLAEYASVARADQRMLVQECVPGGDEDLFVAACYIDRSGKFQAGFNVQKLVQTPPGFGTGCIVQSVACPELFEPTRRLLQTMQFTGIAEVEYKRDRRDGEFKLIEVNPRPWDQHRVGAASGVDLMLHAYCDFAGLPAPVGEPSGVTRKWIAEDAFLMEVLRLMWRRQAGVRRLISCARGPKVFAIWSLRDPLPFVSYAISLVPRLAGMTFQVMRGSSAGPGARQKAVTGTSS